MHSFITRTGFILRSFFSLSSDVVLLEVAVIICEYVRFRSILKVGGYGDINARTKFS